MADHSTWGVRPTLLISHDTPLSEDLVLRVQARLRATGREAWMGMAVGHSGVAALSGTIMVSGHDDPGAALAEVLSAVMAAATDEGIHVVEPQELVVSPAWRDERHW